MHRLSEYRTEDKNKRRSRVSARRNKPSYELPADGKGKKAASSSLVMGPSTMAQLASHKECTINLSCDLVWREKEPSDPYW